MMSTEITEIAEIADYLKTHSEYEVHSAEIDEYFTTLSDRELSAMVIAFKYLKSSFSIVKSNGFRTWKAK